MQSENIRLPRESLKLLKATEKSPIMITPSQKESLEAAQILVDHDFVIKTSGISPEEITKPGNYFATYLEISQEGRSYLGARRKRIIDLIIAISIPLLAAAVGCLLA